MSTTPTPGQLDWYVATRDGDEAKRDLALICTRPFCPSQHLCDIEEDDTIALLVGVIAAHEEEYHPEVKQ